MKTDFPLKRIVIVGGGTAGWMSALIIAHALQRHQVEILVIESPEVGVIGVGEGSTPILKKFFDTLGIDEQEWMPECNATYKSGIRFTAWSGKPEHPTYFHPFATLLDQFTLPTYVAQLQRRLQAQAAEVSPDDYFLSAQLAMRNLAPTEPENFPFFSSYGYHFDAGLLGKFLHKKALAMGIHHQACHVVNVTQNQQGAIASLQTSTGETLSADFFIDCSGFQGLLINQTLKTRFVSYEQHLFNDAAIALPSEIDQLIAPQTTATALKHGWAWKIPLQNRYGNGYVYSSRYTDSTQAETELRQHLGLLEADIPVRHLRMKLGRVEQHWHKNCLAVGLSQGFLEPLEATALYLMQMTIGIFTLFLERGDLSPAAQAAYNQEINDYFDGHRNYIITHYKTTSRTDTEYWRDNARGLATIPDSLQRVFEVWLSGQDLAAELQRQSIDRFYPPTSWYALLAGMGVFPALETAKQHSATRDQVQDFLRRACLNYRSHQQALADLNLAGKIAA